MDKEQGIQLFIQNHVQDCIQENEEMGLVGFTAITPETTLEGLKEQGIDVSYDEAIEIASTINNHLRSLDAQMNSKNGPTH